MKPKRLHPEFIKAGLRQKHGTLLKFELAYGLPVESARDVLRGKSVKRTAQAMADALGVPVEVIRQSKKPVGKPAARRKPANNTSTKRDAHRLNDGVN